MVNSHFCCLFGGTKSLTYGCGNPEQEVFEKG